MFSDYSKVHAIIGGSTGLETLRIAKQNPEVGIVVIDGYASIAKEIFRQLGHMDPREPSPKWDWDLTGINHFDWIKDARWSKDPVWTRVEHEFLKYRGSINTIAPRVTFIDSSTEYLNKNLGFPPEVFSQIHFLYPASTKDTSIYNFAGHTLKTNGTMNIVTERPEVARQWYLYGGPQVIAHGRIDRSGGIVNPLSVFDLRMGQHGYFFVNIRKRAPIPERKNWQIFLSELPLVAQLHDFNMAQSAQFACE